MALSHGAKLSGARWQADALDALDACILQFSPAVLAGARRWRPDDAGNALNCLPWISWQKTQ